MTFSSDNFMSFILLPGRGILRPLKAIYNCALRIYDESNHMGKLVSSSDNCNHVMVEQFRCLIRAYSSTPTTTQQLHHYM